MSLQCPLLLGSSIPRVSILQGYEYHGSAYQMDSTILLYTYCLSYFEDILHAVESERRVKAPQTLVPASDRFRYEDHCTEQLRHDSSVTPRILVLWPYPFYYNMKCLRRLIKSTLRVLALSVNHNAYAPRACGVLVIFSQPSKQASAFQTTSAQIPIVLVPRWPHIFHFALNVPSGVYVL